MVAPLRLLIAGALSISFAALPIACGFPEYGGFKDTTSGTGAGAGGSSTSTGGTGGITSSSSTGGTGGGGGPNCTKNADCEATLATPVCDPSTGTCVPCLPTDDPCPIGQYCTAAKICAPGCADDMDCLVPGVDGGAPLHCDVATHVCLGCSTDDSCPPGLVCDPGTTACVPGCTLSHACQGGFDCCNGQCADLEADEANCGACDTPCAPPQATGKCLAGACTVAACDAGKNDCDHVASNGCESDPAIDPANCGACDAPCAALPNALPACNGGACLLGPCKPNFDDCNVMAGDGCEVNLDTSVAHCGGCETPCAPQNANASCIDGQCGVASCTGGFLDCDLNPATGCEIDGKIDAQNCGSCLNVCSLPHASAECQGSLCKVDMCAQPFADCDLMPGNGCEINTNTDAQNCSACGTVCNLSHATASCSNGVCTIVQCDQGFADCDGLPGNGCEINTDTHPQNCGACGAACSQNHGTGTCSGGQCAITCDQGFASCDGLISTGCETQTSNNVNHCGMCNNPCPPQGGTPACVNNMCGVSNCAPNKGDCDGIPGNGCETDINTVQNCGGCGLTCFVANGTPGCAGVNCFVQSCNAGFADCDGLPGNGCETNLKTLSNCGGCGVPCSLSNAIASCATGTCEVVSCTGTFANCNNQSGDGCEINTAIHPGNCGTCGNMCSNNHGTPSCSGGSCSIMCAPNFGDCDGNVGTGCETPTVNNPGACGGCGNVCAVQNGTPACTGVTCTIQSCNAPFADCIGGYGDGCETNTSNSGQHCGMCGIGCTNANGTTSCSAGACAPVCAGGFKSCDGNPNNGCETNVSNNTANCGDCNVQCMFSNAAASCQAGSCVMGACTPPFGDCDVNPATGCETAINTVTNCGSCGAGCTNAHGTPTCSGGACVPSCDPGFLSCNGSASDGCETSTTTLTNCGGCGVACSFANATASCATGTCLFGACNSGFADCNNDTATDGCEINTNTDAGHCGNCVTQCAAGKVCVNGACADACPLGQADCNMLPGDGCEVTTTSDGDHCGSCAGTCSVSQFCQSSACAACAAGLHDCDRSGTNGCESTAATDAQNCGTCGTVCAGAPNATGKCTASACGIQCNAGFSNCDGSAGNGCECSGNICCAGACEPAHINGLGQSFDSCAPLGVPGVEATYSYGLAVAARAAWPFAGTDVDCTCTGNVQCVYRRTASTCAVWVYTKSNSGRVHLNSGNNNCFCASGADPVWK